MNNNIEDIYIGANYNSNNKKSKNTVLIFIINLLILLIAIGAIYMYLFKTETTSTKQLFFTHLSNNNVQELVSENTYEELFEKILNSNYESNSKINFSTNVDIDNEELEGLDISRFTFELKTSSNKSYNKTYSELGIKYSANDVLNPIKIITNEDSIGIAQDETVNKYVGIHYDNIKAFYGIDLDQEKVNKLFKSERNDLTEDDKKELISNNIKKVIKDIPEENYTIQDNIAISQNGENMPVTAYTLKLSQSELNTVLVDFFKNIRNNEGILNKLIYKTQDKPHINIAPTNVTITPIVGGQPEIVQPDDIQPEEIIDENQELDNPEENTEPEFESQPAVSFEPISGEVNEFNDPQVIEGEDYNEEFFEENLEDEFNEEFYDENFENQDMVLLEENNDYIQELELTRIPNFNTVGEEDDINLEILNDIEKYFDLIKLLLGLKISKTQIELEEMLDDFIEELDGMTGNGLTITVYASKEKTEKISITLPNDNTMEIEILKMSDSENKMKLTYLYKGNNSIFATKSNDLNSDMDFDYDDEIISVENELLEEQTNGISIEINKIKTPTDISLDTTINFIENEKINKKINIKSDITGATSSNNITNSLILTVSTKESESKLVADTSYKFPNRVENIEDLTDENCLFVDTLTPEDYVVTMDAIDQKIDYVWETKKERFNFIDTNTKSSKKNSIDRASNSVSREDARRALENKISDILNEAQQNEQEITVQILENLQIDGYEVSSVVNENGAVIVVDIYTFNVNADFNVADA